jgi:hypothetical protein
MTQRILAPVRFLDGLTGVDDIKQFTKYEKIWKEIFELR